jgi:AraC family transcriptional regulator
MKQTSIPDWNRMLQLPPQIHQIGIGIREGRKRYRLNDLWSINVYDYTATVTFDGVMYRIQPGYVAIIPPGTERLFQWNNPVQQRFCHLQFASIDKNGMYSPLFFDISKSIFSFKNRFDNAISYFGSYEGRTQAIVWNFLWHLSDIPAMNPTQAQCSLHPALQVSLEYIEKNLQRLHSIESIAHCANISHCHLIRLFKSHFGITISEYVKNRRVQLAKHLLRHSDCRIKEIAYDIGIPDLHHFNKVMKKATGMAPRSFRKSYGR